MLEKLLRPLLAPPALIYNSKAWRKLRGNKRSFKCSTRHKQTEQNRTSHWSRFLYTHQHHHHNWCLQQDVAWGNRSKGASIIKGMVFGEVMHARTWDSVKTHQQGKADVYNEKAILVCIQAWISVSLLNSKAELILRATSKMYFVYRVYWNKKSSSFTTQSFLDGTGHCFHQCNSLYPLPAWNRMTLVNQNWDGETHSSPIHDVEWMKLSK